MKKRKLLLVFVLTLFIITGCGANNEENNNRYQKQKQEEKKENSQQSSLNNNSTYVEDDEIIEWNDIDNNSYQGEKIMVEKVINCDECVYAYFSDDKTFGTILSKEEYTTDINNLKTSDGKQRHNFFGFVLSDNKITRAYSCILKDNKIYCIEGTTEGQKHESNIAILNQVFASNQCKYISDGKTYTCTDGYYNGNTKSNGYASMHYETSCGIIGQVNNHIVMNCN